MPASPSTPRTSRGKHGTSLLRTVTAATVVGRTSALRLDNCWANAVCRGAPTAFSEFFLDSLRREATSHAKARHGLYPCGLPFWSCFVRSACHPPSSGRRLQRWKKGFRIRAMVNAAVAYLSWLSLGRPGRWAADQRHPLHEELTQDQELMCVSSSPYSFQCRPGE
eukprot:4682039-Amphidinium_carterae.1